MCRFISHIVIYANENEVEDNVWAHEEAKHFSLSEPILAAHASKAAGASMPSKRNLISLWGLPTVSVDNINVDFFISDEDEEEVDELGGTWREVAGIEEEDILDTPCEATHKVEEPDFDFTPKSADLSQVPQVSGYKMALVLAQSSATSMYNIPGVALFLLASVLLFVQTFLRDRVAPAYKQWRKSQRKALAVVIEEEALELMKENKYRAAIDVLHTGVEQLSSKEIIESYDLAALLYLLAKGCMVMAKWSAAESCLYRVDEIYSYAGDDVGMALVYEDLSVVYEALERPREANDMREKAEELVEIRNALYHEDSVDEGEEGEEGEYSDTNEEQEQEQEQEQVIVNAVLVEASRVEMVLVQPALVKESKENLQCETLSLSPVEDYGTGGSSKVKGKTSPLLRARTKSRGLSPRDMNVQS